MASGFSGSEAIDACFASGAQAVLVTGPAGVGKSTLLQAVARTEGTVVRSLEGCRTARDLVARLGGEVGPGELREALVKIVSARPGQVHVLDDAEDLEDGALALLRAALDETPTLRWIVASRIGPRIEGEHVVRVEPLADEESVALMVSLARRSAPEFSLDPRDRAALVEAVRHLGGLPLALALVAPRLALLGPRGLLADVRARGGGEMLDAAIADSLAALRPGERALLDRLALLPGTFELGLLTRLGGDASSVEALHRCSLLAIDRAGRTVRYSVYESVRAHVGRAASDVAALAIEVDGAVVEHARGIVNALRAGDPDASGDLAAYERALAAAAERALARNDVTAAVAAVLALDGVPSVAERQLALVDRVERAARGAPSHAHVLVARARAHFHRGELAQGRADVELALEVTPGDDPWVLVIAATKLAVMRMQSGEDPAPTLEIATRALEGSTDRWLRVLYLRDRALVALRRGDDEGARRDLEEALSLEPVGDELGALVRGVLGQAHQHVGELDAAVARLSEAATLAIASGSAPLGAWALATCGAVETELGRWDDARRHLDDALALATEHRATAIVAITNAQMGQLAHESGDPARATVLYQRGIPTFLRLRQKRSAAFAMAVCAAAEAALGRAPAARKLLDDARRELTAKRPGDDVAFDAIAVIVDVALGRRDADAIAGVEARAASAVTSDELRFAMRQLRRELAVKTREPSASAALRVAVDGGWFETDAGRVHLPERSPLRRVIVALVDAHRSARGSALRYDDLFRAAWPGERARPAAIQNRVKVAISTLRKSGLRELLETADDGYRIEPATAVLVEGRD